MPGVNINEGTQTNIATDAVGTVNYQTVKLDRGAAGASSLFTGTVDAVTNIAGGTITKIGAGSMTVTSGTIFAREIGTNANHPAEFTSVVTGTGTATGTVKAAVAGSTIYVTTAIISAGTATTNIGLSSGTPTSNNVLGTLTFGANGGLMAAPLNPPLRTTSGSALVWSQSGTSNASLTVTGYVE